MRFIAAPSRFFYILGELIKRAYIFTAYDDWTVCKLYRKQGAKIGHNCRIDVRTPWLDAQLVTLGNHVFIAQGVVLHTHDGAAWVLRDEIPNIRITGEIVIGDNCIIGAYSHVFCNVHIGKNSIIGTGSVVISDIPPDSIAMGIPARVVGSTTKYKEKHIKIWKEQNHPPADKDQRYYRL
jgi:acetyltransferase-like isoleucine patch superfamily enzyme